MLQQQLDDPQALLRMLVHPEDCKPQCNTFAFGGDIVDQSIVHQGDAHSFEIAANGRLVEKSLRRRGHVNEQQSHHVLVTADGCLGEWA
ncbi:MAG TPA: hypothetical protein VGM84_15355 [Steroidobacteraceae bacterium]